MDKFYIHWFGGEPLLNENIIDLVMKKVYNFLKKQGTEIYVYFTSNGSLLNKKMAKKAKKLWHANRFQITIDDIGDKYNDVKKYINKKYNYDVCKKYSIFINNNTNNIRKIIAQGLKSKSYR